MAFAARQSLGPALGQARPARRVCGRSGKMSAVVPRRNLSATQVWRASAGAKNDHLSYDPLAKALPPPSGPRFEAEKGVNKLLVEGVVVVMDTLYKDKPFARFFVLETIARVPYFAYTSILHLYETLGWWRRADYLKVHFAESWNEMHHLLIMESLGGSDVWFDRFLAQHIAVVYYWLTCAIYIASPRMAYNLMEQVETHAFHTYDSFLKTDGERLKQLPAPEVALKYYMPVQPDEVYLFDEFQTAKMPGERRPVIKSLYDVFQNIRDDEAEHCVTMRACQTNGALQSPHDAQQGSAPGTDGACSGVLDCVAEYPTGKRVSPGGAAAAAGAVIAAVDSAIDAANKQQM